MFDETLDCTLSPRMFPVSVSPFAGCRLEDETGKRNHVAFGNSGDLHHGKSC